MMKTIQEIATEWGTSRQNIYQLIHAAMRKVYLGLEKKHQNVSPFEITLMIAKEFGVEKEKDFECFYSDFPASIRRKVTKDAMRLVRVNPNTTLEEIVMHNIRTTKRWSKPAQI